MRYCRVPGCEKHEGWYCEDCDEPMKLERCADCGQPISEGMRIAVLQMVDDSEDERLIHYECLSEYVKAHKAVGDEP